MANPAKFKRLIQAGRDVALGKRNEYLRQRDQAQAERDEVRRQLGEAHGERNELRRQLDIALGERRWRSSSFWSTPQSSPRTLRATYGTGQGVASQMSAAY